GQRPRIEDYLDQLPAPARPALFGELLRMELFYHRQQGETPTAEDYGRRFPAYTDWIRSVFRQEAVGSEQPSTSANSPVAGAESDPPVPSAEQPDSPTHLGRYRVTAQLGSGTFSIVYRAYDEAWLHRHVAIKVPKRERVASPQDIAAYLAEARVLASLEH